MNVEWRMLSIPNMGLHVWLMTSKHTEPALRGKKYRLQCATRAEILLSLWIQPGKCPWRIGPKRSEVWTQQ